MGKKGGYVNTDRILKRTKYSSMKEQVESAKKEEEGRLVCFRVFLRGTGTLRNAVAKIRNSKVGNPEAALGAWHALEQMRGLLAELRA